MNSKLEAPTKDLMELIFSDIMFQEAMQVRNAANSCKIYDGLHSNDSIHA